MRFATLFAATSAVITSVGAVPTVQTVEARDFSLNLNLNGLFPGFDLTSANHNGSPLPPWVSGSKPGWYYGPHPGNHPELPCLGGVRLTTESQYENFGTDKFCPRSLFA